MSDLPANVRAITDRHRKVRYRFRKQGWASAYVKGEPGSAKFHRSLAAIIETRKIEAGNPQSPRQPTPKSMDALFARVKLTKRWAEKKASTKVVQSRIIERFLERKAASGKRYGDRPVDQISVAWLDRVFATMSETPAAANVLRKILSGMMREAVRLNWRTDNPVGFTDAYKDGEGLHTWTEDEIAKYRDCHALGTMARLTLELALNTAARRCNVATLTRDDIQAGRIRVDHVKDNEQTSVPMLATTRAALDALPAAPIKHLVITQFGKPFTPAGLGNRMRKWCNEAELSQCSLHGLRKATSRRLGEAGATDAEGQAVTGHKKGETFAYYRSKANRALLADHGFTSLSAHFDQGDVVQPNLSNPKASD